MWFCAFGVLNEMKCSWINNSIQEEEFNWIFNFLLLFLPNVDDVGIFNKKEENVTL